MSLIDEERLKEIIRIEKERIKYALQTEDTVCVESFKSWGIIHSMVNIHKGMDIDASLASIVKSRGFVCFRSTPNWQELIKASALVHFGVKISEDAIRF